MAFVVAVLLGVLVGCGNDEAKSPDGSTNRPTLVATHSVLGDWVRRVAGDDAHVRVLVGPGQDAHTFQPTPDDAAALARATVIFENGLGFEGWLDKAVAAGGGRAERVVVSEGIAPRKVSGHGPVETDPHIWHDVVHARHAVGRIRDALIRIDPDHADRYRSRADTYLRELVELDVWVHGRVKALPRERRKLFTSHDTFGYFADRYGFEVAGDAFGSVSTEIGDPSAAEIARLIGAIRASGVPAVFAENVSNPQIDGTSCCRGRRPARPDPLHGRLGGSGLAWGDIRRPGPAQRDGHHGGPPAMSAVIRFWPYGGRPCRHSADHRSEDREGEAAAVLARRLAAGYSADRPVLCNVSLSLSRGRLAALTGPNGAGKSTLLRTVAGALPALDGRLEVLGLAAGTCHHRIAFLVQRGGIDWTFPVTAAEVALSGRYVHLGWLARPGRRDRDIAAAALEDVGLSDLADRRVDELSGGQQQRVLIARALAQEAELLLLDEPAAGLDASSSQSLMDCLRRLARDGRTILVSTHDRRACEEGVFDEVFHIADGRLLACGHEAAARADAVRRFEVASA